MKKNLVTASTDVSAMQEKIKFCGWAPEVVIKRWRRIDKEASETNDNNVRATADMLWRLLTARTLKTTWEKIRDVDGVPWRAVGSFTSTILKAFYGPQGEQCLTARQRARLVADVSKKSNELAKLIEGTSLDQYLQRANFDSIFLLTTVRLTCNLCAVTY